jgi:hypothetical protein
MKFEAKMDTFATTELQAIGAEPQQDNRQQLLESATNTVAAVKRLVANFDQLKQERDTFDRQLASSVAESETLREQVNDARAHNEQLSKTVVMLTDQMESIAARCTEAVTMLRSQVSKRSPATQAGLPPTDGRSPGAPPAARSILSAPAQVADDRSAGERPAQASTFEPGSSSIDDASRVVHVFTQYLTQSTTADVHKTKSA